MCGSEKACRQPTANSQPWLSTVPPFTTCCAPSPEVDSGTVVVRMSEVRFRKISTDTSKALSNMVKSKPKFSCFEVSHLRFGFPDAALAKPDGRLPVLTPFRSYAVPISCWQLGPGHVVEFTGLANSDVVEY